MDADWQRLWFSTLSGPWASLAVVPGGPGADVSAVAERLATMARENGNADATVLQASGIAATDVPGLMARLTALTAAGVRVIVAADSPAENPSIIPLIRAASAVLLLVRLGESTLQSSREAVDALDRTKVIGSIVIG